MNQIVMSAQTHTPETQMGWILAIESDPARARTLETILRDHNRLTIVSSIGEAIRSITSDVPDLVLTSTFLPPWDEAALTSHLNQIPAASHVQVITIPHFIDSEDASNPGVSMSKVLSFRQHRSELTPPACAPTTVRKQIEEYLEQAGAIRLARSSRQLPAKPRSAASGVAHARTKPEIWLTPTLEVSPVAHSGRPRIHPLGGEIVDRRRARRQTRGELPGLQMVKFPWGAEGKVVNISTGGVLVETTSKLTPGSTVDLQLLGEGTSLSMSARAIRSEVASVDTLGVKYRIAAAFARDVDIHGLRWRSTGASLMPDVLADVLARVLAEVERGAESANLRARFEQELRRVLPIRDIQIRQAPLLAKDGTESIYFTVPGGSEPRSILQAIFERDYQPSAMEFRVLKAAASLTAVVLEFARHPPLHP